MLIQRNTARERTRLGESIVAQEFREAMFAHTLYHCPSFMFREHRAGKKVRVYYKRPSYVCQLFYAVSCVYQSIYMLIYRIFQGSHAWEALGPKTESSKY